MKTYDFIIIGAGAAGLTAAYTAKGFGKKVLLIDKEKPGGDCTWSGCVPSKTLIRIAKEFWNAKKFSPSLTIDNKKTMEKVKNTINEVYSHETPATLNSDGIDFIFGNATFVDSTTISVADSKYIGKKIIIATGSVPLVPPIPGLDNINYLTNKSFFQLSSLPKSITILGGGAIGVELSQALNRLGVIVNLVEMQDRILPKEEATYSTSLQGILATEGVNVFTGHKAVNFEKLDNNTKITLEFGDSKITLISETLMLALGRTPNIDTLNLSSAGVEYTKRGVVVDSTLLTTQKNIYAIGDICSPYQFSHMANVQGIAAVKNAILPLKSKLNYDHVAWCTFSEPELGRAGLTEDEAREKFGNDIFVYDYNFSSNDRAVTENKTNGKAKVITDKKGYIIGASVLTERAGEIINEIQVAKTNKIKLSKLSSVIHPYPTYGEFLNKLGKKALVDILLSNPVVKIFKKNK